MSNGEAGGSRAPYIIICNGRINLLEAKGSGGKIQAASGAASALVTYYGDQLSSEDTKPISDLQHEMMDNMGKWTKAEAKAKVAEMFALLDALEEKFEHHEY